ncbi:MAG: branched-chain amino acid ABC transporter permease [Candidatus Rokubacteria bacterium]|nr:branched-chain amino acid ABC transporter permease [Candidatus Rokubacteria bacterium]
MDTVLQALAQGIAIGGVYALVALALTIVYAVTRLLNFAHGDLMAVAMYLAVVFSERLSWGPYSAVSVIAPLMFLLGLALFYGIFARVLRAKILLVVQITLGLAFVIQNGLLIAFTANYRTVPTVLTGQRWFLGSVVLPAPLVVAFLVSVVLAVGLFLLLGRTDFGRAVRAVAQDADAAALCGLNVRRVQALVFSGALLVLGLVGPMLTPVFILEPSMGLHLTLVSFIVFILGGTSNFLGTLLAGIIIGLAEAFGSLYMQPPALAAVVPYVIFILVLLVRPRGVLGGA